MTSKRDPEKCQAVGCNYAFGHEPPHSYFYEQKKPTSKREEVIEVIKSSSYGLPITTITSIADALLERFCMCEHEMLRHTLPEGDRKDWKIWYQCSHCGRAREVGK